MSTFLRSLRFLLFKLFLPVVAVFADVFFCHKLNRNGNFLREVAFAPHTAAIHLLGESDDPPGELKFQQCTFMLDRGGVAIEADSLANAKVTASACAFAEAMPPGASNRGLSAVLHAADVVPLVRFGPLEGGQPNGYFAVTTPTGDAKPILLVRSPWVAADPRRLLAGDEPWNAFKLNIL